MKIEDIELENNIEMIETVERKTTDPNMFYKVKKIAPTSKFAWIPSCSFDTSVFPLETAKTILSVNLQVLCTLSLYIPVNIVNVWIFISGNSCQNDPDLINRIRVFGILPLVSVIVYPFIVKKKFEHY